MSLRLLQSQLHRFLLKRSRPRPRPTVAKFCLSFRRELSHAPDTVSYCCCNRRPVRLKSSGYIALDPYAMVMLPDGELKVIERAKAKPTTDPFVAASPEEMQESLKAAGLSKYKVEKGKFYFYVYDCSDGFFMHARSILESMLPGVVEQSQIVGIEGKAAGRADGCGHHAESSGVRCLPARA